MSCMLDRFVWVLWLFLSGGLFAAESAPVVKNWEIEGVQRQALVYFPEGKPKTGENYPLVFAFHGHGGNMKHAAFAFGIHRFWPDAIVVYPQGLKTPGQITDPEGRRSGWQANAGDQEDRDLKFYDAMLETLRKEHQADAGRVFSMGHSNGAAFTYLLWAERGDTLTGVAPSAAVFIPKKGPLAPKPVLHLAGWNDPLVKYTWQERMMHLLLKVNQCKGKPEPWSKDEKAYTYHSDAAKTTVFYIHDGEHGWPEIGGELVTNFFKSL